MNNQQVLASLFEDKLIQLQAYSVRREPDILLCVQKTFMEDKKYHAFYLGGFYIKPRDIKTAVVLNRVAEVEGVSVYRNVSQISDKNSMTVLPAICYHIRITVPFVAEKGSSTSIMKAKLDDFRQKLSLVANMLQPVVKEIRKLTKNELQTLGFTFASQPEQFLCFRDGRNFTRFLGITCPTISMPEFPEIHGSVTIPLGRGYINQEKPVGLPDMSHGSILLGGGTRKTLTEMIEHLIVQYLSPRLPSPLMKQVIVFDLNNSFYALPELCKELDIPCHIRRFRQNFAIDLFDLSKPQELQSCPEGWTEAQYLDALNVYLSKNLSQFVVDSLWGGHSSSRLTNALFQAIYNILQRPEKPSMITLSEYLVSEGFFDQGTSDLQILAGLNLELKSPELNHDLARVQYFDIFDKDGCIVIDFGNYPPPIRLLVLVYLLHELTLNVSPNTAIVLPGIEEFLFKSRERERIQTMKSSTGFFIRKLVEQTLMIFATTDPADIDPALLSTVQNFIFFYTAGEYNRRLINQICKLNEHQSRFLKDQNELALLLREDTRVPTLFIPIQIGEYCSVTSYMSSPPSVEPVPMLRPGPESLPFPEFFSTLHTLDLLQYEAKSRLDIMEGFRDLLPRLGWTEDNFNSFIRNSPYFSYKMEEGKQKWIQSKDGTEFYSSILDTLEGILDNNYNLTIDGALTSIANLERIFRDDNVHIIPETLLELVHQLRDILNFTIQLQQRSTGDWNWILVALLMKFDPGTITTGIVKTLLNDYKDLIDEVILNEKNIESNSASGISTLAEIIQSPSDTSITSFSDSINQLCKAIGVNASYPNTPLVVIQQLVSDYGNPKKEMEFLEILDIMLENNINIIS